MHLGLERSTIDFDRPVDWPTLQTLEAEAMEVVRENITVETVFDLTDVRSRFDLQDMDGDEIRVVKIGAYDASACCGVHVLRTGDIGIIRILDLEKKKQGTRMSFCAGGKALAFFGLVLCFWASEAMDCHPVATIVYHRSDVRILPLAQLLHR